MVDMIRKLIPVEVKEVGDRTLEIAGSTEDKDRMGDIIRASGWKLSPFKKNPVFMWAHRYDEPPIGRANRVWVDKETNKLMFKVEFAPPETYEFADTIFKLYKGGFLHATSVGFIPKDWEGKDDENPHPKFEGNVFTSQELLELSAVPVPANPNALVTARDQGLITVKEFEAVNRLVESEEIVTKPEETENYYRIPVKGEEGKHEGHRIRTIDIDKKKGIKALYCGECKKVITYLFSKEDKYGWTMASAQEWVDEHAKSVDEWLVYCEEMYEEHEIPKLYPAWLADNEAKEKVTYKCECIKCGHKLESEKHCKDIKCPKCGGTMRRVERPGPGEESIPEPKPISQTELGDELDYILQAVKEVGINDEQMPAALNLASEIIQRYTGNDIPDDILSTVGAVLNTKNEQRLIEIRQLAQEVMATTGEGERQVGPAVIARQRAKDVAEVANLVIAKLKGKRIY